MKPWEHLDTAQTPDRTELQLWHHDGEYVIRANGYDLMTSRQHTSEDALMRLACPEPKQGARVLVGGLGMGYTLAAALAALPADGRAVVGELIPKVIEWNEGPLGPLAGSPLNDPRVEVICGDVGDVIRNSQNRFDAILLDVDNGPRAHTQRGNSRLYSTPGLQAAHRALRPGGALAVWSVEEDRGFERQLRLASFEPETHRVHAHGTRGRRFVVFVGRRK